MRAQRIQIRRFALMLNLVWLGVIATAGAQGQEVRTTRTAQPVSDPKALVGSVPATPVVLTDRPVDEKAILSVGEAFRRAYNAGDAAAVASLYTDDAELIEENGDRFHGRKTIQDLYSMLFQERKGYSIEIAVDAIRFLGPDVAKEEGRTSRQTERDNGTPSGPSLYGSLRQAGGQMVVLQRQGRARTGSDRIKSGSRSWNGWSAIGLTRARSR